MSLINELKRRNVIRMGILYGISSWLVLQVGDVMFELLGVPDWSLKFVFGILLLGFPFALFFSWAYELTPEGLKRDADVHSQDSITPQTGKRLDRLIILVMTGVIVVLVGERFVTPPSDQAEGGFKGVRAASGSDPGRANAPGSDLSIAVLPFDNMSADADNEYFADGIAEEILNLLAGVDDLEVASRTSSFAFKGKDISIPKIASELKVRYVLEGSVRKAGSQVRITAQLIDARTDRHLWSDTFDRTLDDIFAVQDEIAGAIGDALQIRLLGQGGAPVSAETIDPVMYEQFLEARFFMRRRSSESLEKAIELLEPVVAAEPRFVRGLILLAEALLLVERNPELVEARQTKARSLAETALDINPDLAGGFMVMGYLAALPVDQYRNFRRAIELDPQAPRPHHWLARQLSYSGHLKEALEQINEAVRLEPSNANAHGWRSTVLAALGDIDAAIQDANIQAELGNPIAGHFQAATYHILGQDSDGAQMALMRAMTVEGADREAIQVVLDAVAGGGTERGRLIEMLSGSMSDFAYGYFVLAQMLALGMHVEWLDYVSERPEESLSNTIVWHASLRAMRSDPRFIELMEKTNVTGLWREIGPPPDCRVGGDSFVCGLGGDR